MFDDADRIRDTNYPPLEIGQLQEGFYSEILKWMVHPEDIHLNGHVNGPPYRQGEDELTNVLSS